MLMGQVPLRDLTAHDVRRALKKLPSPGRPARWRRRTMYWCGRSGTREAERSRRPERGGVREAAAPPGRSSVPGDDRRRSGRRARRGQGRPPSRRLRDLVADHRHPHRGGTGAALGPRRLDGDPCADRVPPHMAVWRSVRAGSDTKTERSRRTLGLPQSAVAALRQQRQVAGGGPAGGGRALAGSRSGLHQQYG